MQNEQPARMPYRDRVAPSGPVKWLNMSFTEESLQTIRDYRRKIANETGRNLAMGQALDALIKSHPFAQTSGDATTPDDAPCYIHLRREA